ncbi:glycosyltransferase [Pseudocitrobacter cyperus]|uniref:Glycosyltransferase n=1 Tax=Pseudocitrobacter cyperus TaxID=3112843 RepID=A0ABV0HNG1_9ENTR
MNDMTCTFIIISFNQADTIRESIQSAIEQDCDNFRLVICDDGSTDGTNIIIREVLKQNIKDNIEVIFLENKVNIGIVGNFNRALQYVVGDFFITQAGDDISLANRVSVTKRIFDNNEVSACFSATYDIDDAGNSLGSDYGYTINKRNMRLGGISITSCLYDEAGVLGASAAYRTKLISDFSLAVVAFSEDKSLSLRGALIGKVIFYEEPLVKYRRTSGVTISGRKCLKMYARLMYRRSRYFKSITRDGYFLKSKFNSKKAKSKILKLRKSCVFSHLLLKKKINAFTFIFYCFKSKLYNKVILRAAYYYTKGK